MVANQPKPNVAHVAETSDKLRGWEIHASQAEFVRRVYGVPIWLLYRLFDKEHFLLVEASGIGAEMQGQP